MKKISSLFPRSILSALMVGAMALSSGVGATPVSNCTGQCANASTYLTADMVNRIITQAFNEAKAQGVKAVTIAVVDRVGNVLGVFESNAAIAQGQSQGLPVGGLVTINSGRFNTARPNFISLNALLATPIPTDSSFQTGVGGKIPGVRYQGAGLENVQVPSSVAAIAKAITGAYLSSEGNAFSTYTAAQIIQEHFNPGVTNQPAGPLYGVQFSQLPCGDFVTQDPTLGVGPHRSPLGFSGQRGGLPLYLRGTPVGGIGVIATSQYAIELNINTPAVSVDEQIAIAGSYGFLAPSNRRADVIHVGGLTFRYTSLNDDQIASNPAAAGLITDIMPSQGNFVAVPGYFEATNGSSTPLARAGTAFTQPESGIVPATAPFTGLNAYMMSDSAGNNRYPPTDGAPNNGQQLTASDVTTLLKNVVGVANSARAQIRQPLPTNARLSGAVVDLEGNILGILRSEDAPVFSTDVALQKARTAAFFTQPNAASLIYGTPTLASYASNAQRVIPRATRGKFLEDGTAMTPRAMGNLARPLLPDGIFDTPNGPFSIAYQPTSIFVQGFNQWSPFNIGIQLDLEYSNLLYAIANPFTTNPQNIQNCAMSFSNLGSKVLANGPQLFAGGVPLYKNGVLVGAIGTSGDGIDQDDMGSFLAAYRTGLTTRPRVGLPKTSIRSNRVKFNDGRQTVALRFVECPFAPFLDNNTQKACSGK
ncbi:MAG: hypothetical protein RL333_1964 [Pseudomonadota bacterium]